MSDDTRPDEAAPESTLRTEWTIAGPLPVPVDEPDLRDRVLADAAIAPPAAPSDSPARYPSYPGRSGPPGGDGVTPAGTIVIEDGVIPADFADLSTWLA